MIPNMGEDGLVEHPRYKEEYSRVHVKVNYLLHYHGGIKVLLFQLSEVPIIKF